MRWMALAALAAWSAAGAVAADSDPAAASKAPELSAEQIVEKNEAARGGVEAWRKIQTMVWAGHMETPSGPTSQVPFVLQQKRPNKTRFELNAIGQRTLRVFDGAHGWKVRSGRDGSPDVQPFTPQEVKFAQQVQGIDGPLMDYQAKGTTVALEGTDEVEGRKAYRLSVRSATGESHHVWVDAQTFLDIKYDRTSYTRAGEARTVFVYLRDYRAVEGVQIPAAIETGNGTQQGSEKLVIEKIALNAPLDDRLFGKPGGGTHRHHTITIDPEHSPEALGIPRLPLSPRSAPPQAAPAPPASVTK
jgi:outer membrane lipoprotein-sorting protein